MIKRYIIFGLILASTLLFSTYFVAAESYENVVIDVHGQEYNNPAADTGRYWGMVVQTKNGITQLISFNISLESQATNCYAKDLANGSVYNGTLINHNCSFNPFPTFENDSLFWLYTTNASYWIHDQRDTPPFNFSVQGINLNWLNGRIDDSNYSTVGFEVEAIWTRIINLSEEEENVSYIEWANESILNVNSSDYWDNLDTFNSSQMEYNSLGILSISSSWYSLVWASLFRNYFNQQLNITNTPTFVGINLTGGYIYNNGTRYSFADLNATSTGGIGNPFDQSLNTTDNPKFANLRIDSKNVSIGYVAGNNGGANTGNYLTAVGFGSANENAGNNLVAIGPLAGKKNSGINIVSVGYSAGEQNKGNYSTGVGYRAGYSNFGNYATALGYYTGQVNTGNYLTAFGGYSGFSNTGNYLTSLGGFSGYYNTGEYSTFIGYQAGRYNNGSYVMSIGSYAGYSNSGNNSIFLGYEAGKDNTLDNQFIVKQSNVNSVPLIQGDFESGIVSISSINVLVTSSLPNCSSSYSGTIMRNNSGVYGCSSGSEWVMLF